MEQSLKYIGNSAMLSVPASTVKEKNLDKTTLFEFLKETKDDILSFRIIRPKQLVFPKLRKKLSLSSEMKEMIENPVFPTEQQLEDPRIKHLFDENFR